MTSKSLTNITISYLTIICSQEESFRRRLTSCHDNNILREIGILNYPNERENSRKRVQQTINQIDKTFNLPSSSTIGVTTSNSSSLISVEKSRLFEIKKLHT